MDIQKTQSQSLTSTIGTDALVGTTVAERFRILGKAGSGCLTDVYKACELSSVRTVALKIIRLTSETTKSGLELFTSNARLTVQHPNLTTMHSCGLTAEGEPWLALEWLEGKTLAEVLATEGNLSVADTVQIFQQIADAVGYAHSQGEVHMNLKPSNVFLVERDGKPFVKLCDFGLAKMLIEREMEMADEKSPARGTPLYMSPEQFRGTRIDSRSDIYSFGCMMYECLYGRPPHQGVDLLETMDRHMNVNVSFPSEPELSEQLQAVLTKLLDKDSARRYRTLSDAMADVERALQGEFPVEEILPAPVEDARAVDFITAKRGHARKKGREPWLFLMGCVTVLLFVLIFQQCMNMAREWQGQSMRNHWQKLEKRRVQRGVRQQ